ncbi:DUF1905 domain-containing protein [Rhodoluna sp.]|uniref:DUF1905 domain-containing protein n=1 Tax=Rhodoluna sp. TaxID=1969481 RepID=UPI0025D91803|nr:DUF1905 domain-containing protein [Rhodoluna sp.]
MIYEFESLIYLWKSESAWHFLKLNQQDSDEIKEITAPLRRGFGSVRVDVTIGKTSWRTSIFPDSSVGAYILPVKAAVRKAEALSAGSKVTVHLETVDF